MYKFNKFVSIIMPNYNSSFYLNHSIQSVINQTYDYWELIIIDDNSQDNSLNIINKYINKDSRIKLIKLKNNKHIYKVRNVGIKKSKGEFIAFIDSDDIWLNNKLEESIKFSLLYDYSFIFTSYIRYDENNKFHLSDYIVPNKVSFNNILYTNPIAISTVLLNISKIGKYYQPNLYKREDYGLWLLILKNIKYAYGLNRNLTIYIIRNNSLSRNKINLIYYQFYVYNNYLHINFFISLFYLICWIFNGLKKYEKI